MIDGRQFILWGSAGHAKVLAGLISLYKGKIVALFDNNPKAVSVVPDVPLFIGQDAFINWITESEKNYQKLYGLIAIGGARGHDRLLLQNQLVKYGVTVDTIIHPQASVCDTAILGLGTQVLAQAVVSADVVVGDGCIINHRASVDHECLLGDGVHLAPGATLCGCVTIGNNVMVGAGAVLLPRITIGDDTIVGAGAVVTHDLPVRVIAVGNPARIIRNR